MATAGADLIPQSLRRAPDAGGAEKSAESSDHVRQSLKARGNAPFVAKLAPNRQTLLVRCSGKSNIALT